MKSPGHEGNRGSMETGDAVGEGFQAQFARSPRRLQLIGYWEKIGQPENQIRTKGSEVGQYPGDYNDPSLMTVVKLHSGRTYSPSRLTRNCERPSGRKGPNAEKNLRQAARCLRQLRPGHRRSRAVEATG